MPKFYCLYDIMKAITFLFAIFLSGLSYGQQQGYLAHGKVFGSKPNMTGMMDASKVEAYMDKKTRINITIKGRVLKVTNPKGGWFQMDAGKGRIINAHFRTYDVTIPPGLKGRNVIADGVAEKQFIADDQQHLAGDTVTGKKQHSVKTNPKQKLIFEVNGLMVE
ncbi:MAG: hypothetical protein JWQ63_546 [Mucilaginibacter sp.]|jgi:hypothetical protein|nr:hypothetical protein [Mucilaginibacter sp.]